MNKLRGDALKRKIRSGMQFCGAMLGLMLEALTVHAALNDALYFEALRAMQ
jgi:hypothetical protein